MNLLQGVFATQVTIVPDHLLEFEATKTELRFDVDQAKYNKVVAHFLPQAQGFESKISYENMVLPSHLLTEEGEACTQLVIVENGVQKGDYKLSFLTMQREGEIFHVSFLKGRGSYTLEQGFAVTTSYIKKTGKPGQTLYLQTPLSSGSSEWATTFPQIAQ